MSEVTWFKVLTDIFSDDKIKILQSMPEGDSLLVMWFKVLSQAGKTNDGGYIYLKKNIPYTSAMFSTLFGKQQQLVEFAMRTFSEFGMIDIDDKGYVFVTNWEKHQSIDALEKIKEQTRIRVSAHREKKKVELLQSNVTVTLPVTQSNAIDIELDLDLEKDTTTTAHAYSETILDVHYKIFGNYSMTALMSQFVTELLNRGYTEVFIKEIMYEAGESSGGKPNIKYLKTISERWIKENIYTRVEAQRKRVVPIQTNKQSYPIAVGQAISNIDETKDFLAEMERSKEAKRKRLAAKQGENT